MEEKKNHGVLTLVIAALLLVIDQVTKHFVLTLLKPHSPVTVIPGFLEFSYIENTGAAFGLFKGMIWLVGIVAVAAFIFIFIELFRYREHTFFSYAASAMVAAGGIGNLIDRVRFGFVVDFIHVYFFDYIFNFADCCITVGAVLFAIHVLLASRREQKEPEQAGEEKE